MRNSDEAQAGGESSAQRPWLKPTSALARFAPTARLDRGPQIREQTVTRYGYSIGHLGLLVGKHVGCEVIALPTIARIPTTPTWLLGVANLRGGLVPIFDLRALFELAGGRPGAGRFSLIFDRGDQAVGILVAEHPTALTRLDPLPQPPTLPAVVREFVAAAYRNGQSIWLEFDHRRFFDSIAQRMTG